MKKIGMAAVLMFAIFAVPCLAQQKAAAQSTEAPALTPDQKVALQAKIIKIQSNLLTKNQNTEQFDAAQKALDSEDAKLSQEIGALISEYTKNMDQSKWKFDANTLTFVAVTPTKPPAK